MVNIYVLELRLFYFNAGKTLSLVREKIHMDTAKLRDFELRIGFRVSGACKLRETLPRNFPMENKSKKHRGISKLRLFNRRDIRGTLAVVERDGVLPVNQYRLFLSRENTM